MSGASSTSSRSAKTTMVGRECKKITHPNALYVKDASWNWWTATSDATLLFTAGRLAGRQI